MEILLSPEVWISFLTLSALEIVLGIDNIIFIAILASRLPKDQQEKARKLGLTGALASRLLLLSLISFIVKMDQPWLQVLGFEFSGKSLTLLAGGLFLLFKATKEIHHKIDPGAEVAVKEVKGGHSMMQVVLQISILDIVFSIDSVITAVGLTPYIWIMVAANVVALLVMLMASGPIARLVEKFPSLKVLALSFLLMLGLVLVCEGFSVHIPKGYIYFAMGFSIMVEVINLKAQSRKKIPAS